MPDRQTAQAGEARVSLSDLLQQCKVSVSLSSELRACISLLSEDPEVCSLTLTALLCNPGPVRKPRKICKIFVANPAFPFIPRFKVKGFQQS